MHLPPPPLHRTPNCTYACNKRPCCPCGLRPQAAPAPLVCRALAFYPFLQHCPVIRHSFAERVSSCLPLPKPFLSSPMAFSPIPWPRWLLHVPALATHQALILLHSTWLHSYPTPNELQVSIDV